MTQYSYGMSFGRASIPTMRHLAWSRGTSLSRAIYWGYTLVSLRLCSREHVHLESVLTSNVPPVLSCQEYIFPSKVRSIL